MNKWEAQVLAPYSPYRSEEKFQPLEHIFRPSGVLEKRQQDQAG
jgi:hypothetical protein